MSIHIELTSNRNYKNRRYVGVVYTDPYNYRKKFATGVSVDIHHWDKDMKRVKRTGEDYEFKNVRIEAKLANVVEARKTFFIQHDRFPSVQEMEKMIRVNRAKITPMSDFLASYLEYCKKKGFAKSTIRQVESFIQAMEKYEYIRNKPIQFSEITMPFAEDFARNLTNGTISPKGWPIAASTVQLYIFKLSGFMRWARITEGLHKNDEYINFNRAAKGYLTIRVKKKVSLSHEEWMKIYNITDEQLPGHPQTKKLKRMAIDAAILCYCLGRRINEVVLMKMDDLSEIDGVQFFTNIAKKVNAEFMVPLNDLAKEIIARQGYEEGRIFRPGDQRMKDDSFMTLCTDVLKLAVKALDMDRKVEFTYGHGKQLIKEEKMLSEAICVHCARGDFGNRFLMQNMGKNIDTTKVVQKLFGHASVATTEGYLKSHPLSVAKQMNDLAF